MNTIAVAARAVVDVAENEALFEWTVGHNCSQYATGTSVIELRDGLKVVVYAGWNSESSHADCLGKHVPTGRGSEACISYWFRYDDISYADALTLVEASLDDGALHRTLALENLSSVCDENHDGHDDSICRVCTLTVLAERTIAKARGEAVTS